MSDDWLDDLLLADDPPSARDWKQKARGGDATDAYTGIPTRANITLAVRIEQWRIFRAHCTRTGIPPAIYARQAIGARMVAEGVPPDAIPNFLSGTNTDDDD